MSLDFDPAVVGPQKRLPSPEEYVKEQERPFEIRAQFLSIPAAEVVERHQYMQSIDRAYSRLMRLLTQANVSTLRSSIKNPTSLEHFNNVVLRYCMSTKFGATASDKVVGESDHPNSRIAPKNERLFFGKDATPLSLEDLRSRSKAVQNRLRIVLALLEEHIPDFSIPTDHISSLHSDDACAFYTVRELMEDRDTMQVPEKLTQEMWETRRDLQSLATLRDLLGRMLARLQEVRRERGRSLSDEEMSMYRETLGHFKRDGIIDTQLIQQKVQQIGRCIDTVGEEIRPFDCELPDVADLNVRSLVQDYRSEYDEVELADHNLGVLCSLKDRVQQASSGGVASLSAYRRAKQLLTLASIKRAVVSTGRSPAIVSEQNEEAAKIIHDHRFTLTQTRAFTKKPKGWLPHPEVLIKAYSDYRTIAAAPGMTTPQLLSFPRLPSEDEWATDSGPLQYLGEDDRTYWALLTRLPSQPLDNSSIAVPVAAEQRTGTMRDDSRSRMAKALRWLPYAVAGLGVALTASLPFVLNKGQSKKAVADRSNSPVVKPDDTPNNDPFIGVPPEQYEAEERAALLAHIADTPRPPPKYYPFEPTLTIERSLEPDPLRNEKGESDFDVNPFEPPVDALALTRPGLPIERRNIERESPLLALRDGSAAQLRRSMIDPVPSVMAPIAVAPSSADSAASRSTSLTLEPNDTVLDIRRSESPASIPKVTSPSLEASVPSISSTHPTRRETTSDSTPLVAAPSAMRRATTLPIPSDRAFAPIEIVDTTPPALSNPITDITAQQARVAAEAKKAADEKAAKLAAEQERMRIEAEKPAEKEKVRIAQEKEQQRLTRIQMLNTQIEDLFVKAEDPKTNEADRNKFIAALEKLIEEKEALEKAGKE
ncbi:MAG: hypothetical protein ABL890_00345 [Candidatus Peribacteraceae bacterium]